jgi:hypothetical protein
MKVRFVPLFACLLIGLLLVAAQAKPKEEAGEDPAFDCPFGIIEGPDPITYSDCPPFKQPKDKSEDYESSSEPSRPDVGEDPRSGRPFMTWSEDNAGDHDIAFLQWTDEGWGPVEYVTSTVEDDLDPRAFVTVDGEIFLTWWRAGAVPEVRFARRDPQTGRWSIDFLVAQGARRPSIAVVVGAVMVAYEREIPNGGHEIVVAERSTDGTITRTVVSTTERTAPLDVRLHDEGGRLWLDWKQSDTELAYAQWLEGSWSAVATTLRVNPSWSAEQQARRRIRDALRSR